MIFNLRRVSPSERGWQSLSGPGGEVRQRTACDAAGAAEARRGARKEERRRQQAWQRRRCDKEGCAAVPTGVVQMLDGLRNTCNRFTSRCQKWLRASTAEFAIAGASARHCDSQCVPLVSECECITGGRDRTPKKTVKLKNFQSQQVCALLCRRMQQNHDLAGKRPGCGTTYARERATAPVHAGDYQGNQ